MNLIDRLFRRNRDHGADAEPQPVIACILGSLETEPEKWKPVFTLGIGDAIAFEDGAFSIHTLPPMRGKDHSGPCVVVQSKRGGRLDCESICPEERRLVVEAFRRWQADRLTQDWTDKMKASRA